MLVDAAKQGDVEIPYFCYEPKLGQPVGACRMCLVEIEGIPKLQTSCSTPVKDGMVVHTQTDRVRHAQNAIVEFLLVNHPLDCPVCDKGGECPLQDITFGWGLGRSRFIEPKRHFEKPLALSPLIAIDRERCILCYRCVRFSQEIAEDYQLIFTERGAHTFVGTLRRSPVRGAVQRQHHRAVPGRRAHLPDLPVPRPPVGHRGRRRDLHAVPVAVQRRVHRPRREGRARAGARRATATRRRRRLAVRQGPLRLPGDPRRRADHRSRWCATAASCATGLLGARARTPPPAWPSHAGAVGALVGGQATNEEGFLLQRLMREGLQLARTSTRAPAAACSARARARARRPGAAGHGARPRVRPHGADASAASRSTTRRSSTCGSARASAATASSSRSRPPGRARSTPTPGSSCGTPPGDEADVPGRAGRWRRRRARRRASRRSRCWPRAAARRRRGRRDRVGRAARPRRRARSLLSVADAPRPRRPRRRRAARDPGRRQRPRAARGGRAPGRRPGLHGRSATVAAGRERARRSPARPRRRRHQRPVPVPDRPGPRPPRPRAVGAGAAPRRAGRRARLGPHRGARASTPT